MQKNNNANNDILTQVVEIADQVKAEFGPRINDRLAELLIERGVDRGLIALASIYTFGMFAGITVGSAILLTKAKKTLHVDELFMSVFHSVKKEILAEGPLEKE